MHQILLGAEIPFSSLNRCVTQEHLNLLKLAPASPAQLGTRSTEIVGRDAGNARRLRVARTAPYMHDGSLRTLEDVVDYYDKGGNANPGLDPELRPLQLSNEEKRGVVAFLKSLSGRIVEGVTAVPRKSKGFQSDWPRFTVPNLSDLPCAVPDHSCIVGKPEVISLGRN